MIIVISPAKTLDFETPPTTSEYTQPSFLEHSTVLIERLRRLSPAQISTLMGISDPLAALNAARYADWSLPFTPANAKAAVLAFNGDVYEGLDAPTLTPASLQFAQQHLRILSGLYGVLRPLDLIQPYRLEMGTHLDNPRGKDLYTFWDERISDAIEAALQETGSSALVNLASDEYFSAVKPRRLSLPVIQPVFEDWNGGRYRVVSFFAKRARGLMARYAVSKKLRKPEGLKRFAVEGYAFEPGSSSETLWVFRRKLAT